MVYGNSDQNSRRITRITIGFIFLFSIFSLGFDSLCESQSLSSVQDLFSVIEDWGEMVVMSFICFYITRCYCKHMGHETWHTGLSFITNFSSVTSHLIKKISQIMLMKNLVLFYTTFRNKARLFLTKDMEKEKNTVIIRKNKWNLLSLHSLAFRHLHPDHKKVFPTGPSGFFSA